MENFSTYPTQPLNETEPNFSSNMACSRGGLVVLDTLFTNYVTAGEVASRLMCTVAGNVVLECVDGKVMYIPAIQIGVPYNFKFRRVLTNTVINEVTYITTATGLWWYGGKS